jgi:hypothetical protein
MWLGELGGLRRRGREGRDRDTYTLQHPLRRRIYITRTRNVTLEFASKYFAENFFGLELQWPRVGRRVWLCW